MCISSVGEKLFAWIFVYRALSLDQLAIIQPSGVGSISLITHTFNNLSGNVAVDHVYKIKQ